MTSWLEKRAIAACRRAMDWHGGNDSKPTQSEVLAWATYQTDDDLLRIRNLGLMSLAWIRANQGPAPRWDEMPSDQELLAARRTLMRFSSALFPVGVLSEPASDVWGGIVEARRILTVAVSWLREWDDARFGLLWEKMLEQDRD